METSKFETKTRLSPERQAEIIQKCADMGFSLEDEGQHFVAHSEADGKKVARYFPKWETIDLEHGSSAKTEDSIEIFFRFGPEISVAEGMKRLQEHRGKN